MFTFVLNWLLHSKLLNTEPVITSRKSLMISETHSQLPKYVLLIPSWLLTYTAAMSISNKFIRLLTLVYVQLTGGLSFQKLAKKFSTEISLLYATQKHGI